MDLRFTKDVGSFLPFVSLRFPLNAIGTVTSGSSPYTDLQGGEAVWQYAYYGMFVQWRGASHRFK